MKRQILQLLVHSLKCQQQRPVQDQARNQELHLGLLPGKQGWEHLFILCCLSRGISRELDGKWNNRDSNWGLKPAL